MTTQELKKEIELLRKEKNAIILAHYYTPDDVQEIADFVGDSLALSRIAANNDADIILFAGVHFMAETAKVLSPHKVVLLPDLEAGCSLADSCDAVEFEKFVKQHPNHTVISYVNTTVGVKAHTDIVCTSSNAINVVNSLAPDAKIIFGPDRNLGNYVKTMTGRKDMVIWDGACHVHEQFSLERILEIKKENPDAKILTHPECKKPIHIISDIVGSTSELLEFAVKDSATKFIVVTEPGILYKMKEACPNKEFIPAPPTDSTCGCNDCSYMKLNTLQKIYDALKDNKNVIELDEDVRKKAEKSIRRMLEL